MKKIVAFVCIVMCQATFVFSAELSITLKNIEICNVSVRPFKMGVTQDPIFEQRDVRANQVVHITIPDELLPGEFVVRYDYALDPEQSLYPAEQMLIVNQQSLSWSVNPVYCNNAEKTWFQEGEIENTLLRNFNNEIKLYQDKIQMLQQFLMSYDKTSDRLFRLAKKEYQQACIRLNREIETFTEGNQATFAKSFFQLSAIPNQVFEGDPHKNMANMLEHYFDEIDFNDSLLLRINGFTKMLNNFVNLSAQNVELITQEDIEKFYGEVAIKVIEKAKNGHPLVFGFVVDYFYIGFEKNNFNKAMQVLYPYLTDVNCKTSQRIALEKRLQGSKTLVIGNLAPDFDLNNSQTLHSYIPDSNYKLVLFWSADCYHCEEELKNLIPVYTDQKKSGKMEIITVSLDETEYEITKWKQKTASLQDWLHLRPDGGIESIPCKKYFITSTPSMFLIDSKTNILLLIPRDSNELSEFINKN